MRFTNQHVAHIQHKGNTDVHTMSYIHDVYTLQYAPIHNYDMHQYYSQHYTETQTDVTKTVYPE